MLTTNRFFPALFIGLSIASAPAVTIEIDYTYDTSGFFSETTRNGFAARATIEAAAAFYSEILTDSLSPIESDVDSNNNYEVSFQHPSSFKYVIAVPFLELPADTLRIYVGSRNLESLAIAGIGTATISGDSDFVADASQRGQDFGTESEPKAEYAPWGGYITFNSST